MKNKHLSLSDRILIESLLNQNNTFKFIADSIGKDPTTISKEIKNNSKTILPSAFNNYYVNHCKNNLSCNKTNICSKSCKHKKCSSCYHCNSICDDFTPNFCSKLSKASTVCNYCSSKRGCRKVKRSYVASFAHDKYNSTLKESRSGVKLDPAIFNQLDDIISSGVKKGQSIYHISSNNKLPVSSRTIYRFFENQYFTVTSLDLPRKLRFKPKSKTKSSISYNKLYDLNRKYSDFLTYVEEYNPSSIVEMDTVEGIKGGKVLLTFTFRNSNLFLCYILKSKTHAEVVNAINNIQKQIGIILFRKLFSVILTDRGCEFKGHKEIEFCPLTNKKRTSLFYCDPQISSQKPHVENSHVKLRDILKKGSSFNDLTQGHANLIFNNLNNLSKAALNGETSYQRALKHFSKYSLDKLGCHHIPHNNINITPKLIK